MTYDPAACGARCDVCILAKMRQGDPVPPQWNNSAISIVSSTPEDGDLVMGRPLSGAAGIELGNHLTAIGIQRQDVNLHLAIACQPPAGKMIRVKNALTKENKRRKKDGEELLPTPLECCRPRLLKELESVTQVVVMGKDAYESVTPSPHLSIDAVQGNLVDGPMADGIHRRVVPVVHPGRVTHETRWRVPFRKGLQRAFRWFSDRLEWQEPTLILDPTADWFIQHAEPWLMQQAYLIYDTETNDLEPLRTRAYTVQIGTADWVVCLAFRDKITGEEMHSAADSIRLAESLERLMTNGPPLFGHNAGSYDRQVMWAFGDQYLKRPIRAKLSGDTVLIHRFVDPDLPHSLGFVGSMYTDVHEWKSDGRGPENNETLWKYGCLREGMPVVLPDGSTRAIDHLVREKYAGEVMSWNKETGQMEPRRVIGWFRALAPQQNWVSVRTSGTRERTRGLVVTPEHKVFVQCPNGQVVQIPAEDLCPGDLLLLPERALGEERAQALLGTLLGDSIVVVSPHFRADPASAPRAGIAGGHATRSGLTLAKIAAMDGFFAAGGEQAAKEIQILPKPPGHGTAFLPFYAKNSAEAASMRPLLYDESGRRRLRVEVVRAAGAIGRAWWFMDDGCRQNGARATRNTDARGGKAVASDKIVLNTQRYPREDVDQVVAWLRAVYGPTTAGADNVIRLGVAASRAFCAEIAPHVFPCARYKLPRDVAWAEYTPFGPRGCAAATAAVTDVGPYDYVGTTRTQAIRARARYCLTVEGNNNFFTSFGLVANSKDVSVSGRILPPLWQACTDREQRAAKVSEEMRPKGDINSVAMCPGAADPRAWTTNLSLIHDHQMQGVCVEMHGLGILVDQKKRAWAEAMYRGEEAKWRSRLQDALISAGYSDIAGFEDVEEIDEFAWLTEREYTGDGEVSYASWNDRKAERYRIAVNRHEREIERKKPLSVSYDGKGSPIFNPRSGPSLRHLLFDIWDLPFPDYLPKEAQYTQSEDKSVADLILRAYLADPKLSEEQHRIIHAARRVNKMRSMHGRFLRKLVPYEQHMEDVRRWREAQVKKTGKWHKDGEPGLVVWEDGRLRVNWNAHGTGVGRLSSGGRPSRINLQTFPDAIRGIFIPSPGHVFVGADLDSIHMKIIANIWRIPTLVNGFMTKGFDPHATLATVMYGDKFTGEPTHPANSGRDWEGPAKKMRNTAKTLRYTGAYGAGVPTIHATMTRQEDEYGNLADRTLSTKEVRLFHREWMAAEPEWKQAWANEMQLFRDHGYLLDPILGRRADFTDGEDPNQISNYRVLSAEAGIMGPATVRVRNRCPPMGWSASSGLCGQFHDAMLLEVPGSIRVEVDPHTGKKVQIRSGRVQEAMDILTEEMNVVVPGWQIPITATAKAGMDWKAV